MDNIRPTQAKQSVETFSAAAVGISFSTFKAQELSLLYTSHRVLTAGGNGMTHMSFQKRFEFYWNYLVKSLGLTVHIKKHYLHNINTWYF